MWYKKKKEGGKNMAKKKTKSMLSSFSIILILIFGLGILSHLLPDAQFIGEEIVNKINSDVDFNKYFKSVDFCKPGFINIIVSDRLVNNILR